MRRLNAKLLLPPLRVVQAFREDSYAGEFGSGGVRRRVGNRQVLMINDTELMDYLETLAQRAWASGVSLVIMPPKGAVTLRDGIRLHMDDLRRFGDGNLEDATTSGD